MKTKHLLLRVLCGLMLGMGITLTPGAVSAQVKIGDNPTTINAGSVLELESTSKGLLMPRISLTNTTTWGLLGTPAAGMHVYNTNTGIVSTNVAYPTLTAKIGEYYWDGTGWVALGGAQSTDVVLRVESGTQNVTTAALVSVNFNTKKFDRGNNFNLAADEFVAPSAGFYNLNFSLRCSTTETYQTGRYVFLTVNGATDRILINEAVDANDGLARTSSALLSLNAGDVVKVTIGTTSNLAFTVTSSILEIIKLSN